MITTGSRVKNTCHPFYNSLNCHVIITKEDGAAVTIYVTATGMQVYYTKNTIDAADVAYAEDFAMFLRAYAKDKCDREVCTKGCFEMAL